MPTELTIHAVQQGPLEFAISDGEHEITIDYPLPGEDRESHGMTPLRLLLAALAGCSGNSVAALLRRDDQPVARIEVEARGLRRDEHPTAITDIDLAFTVVGDVDPARVEHALMLSEAQLCPIWAMLKPSTSIRSSFTVVDET
jgi:putative redox protein